MTWILLALAAVLYLTQTEQGQKLSEDLGLDKLLPVGTPILLPPGTPPPATTPPATVPGGTVTLPGIQQPAPASITVEVTVPSQGAYPVPAIPAHTYSGPDRSGLTTPAFRIPTGLSSSEWLQKWVHTFGRWESGMIGGSPQWIPYAKCDLMPDFAVKGRLSGIYIEADGRMYYDYLRRHDHYVLVATLNGIPYHVIPIKGGGKPNGRVAPAEAPFASVTGDPVKGGFTFGFSRCGPTARAPVVHAQWWRREELKHLPMNSVSEIIEYYPNLFVQKTREILTFSGGSDVWGEIGTTRLDPQGNSISREEWKGRKDGTIPGFMACPPISLVSNSSESARWEEQTDLQKAHAYIEWYKLNPWTIEVAKTHPTLRAYINERVRGRGGAALLHEIWMAEQAGVSSAIPASERESGGGCGR